MDYQAIAEYWDTSGVLQANDSYISAWKTYADAMREMGEEIVFTPEDFKIYIESLE